MFFPGQIVKDTLGAVGIVQSVDERKVVVRFAATGEIKLSPWGPYLDAGATGHFFTAYVDRALTPAR